LFFARGNENVDRRAVLDLLLKRAGSAVVADDANIRMLLIVILLEGVERPFQTDGGRDGQADGLVGGMKGAAAAASKQRKKCDRHERGYKGPDAVLHDSSFSFGERHDVPS